MADSLEIMNSSEDLDSMDGDNMPKSKWFMWRVHDKRRIQWDLFIMLFAIWNSIQIPYSIAFNEDQETSVFNIILSLMIDSFFIADIFINFRTTYMDEESGEEITSTHRIAAQYLKGK